MDANPIVAAVRSLSSASSRRDALAALSGALVAGLATAIAPVVTEAKKVKRKKKCCKHTCAGKLCGPDGCGGVCGVVCAQLEPFTTCCQGECHFPTGAPDCCMAPGEICTPDGGATFGPTYCCSKSCDTGAGHTNLCD